MEAFQCLSGRLALTHRPELSGISSLWGEGHNTSHFLYDNKTVVFYGVGFLGHQLRMNLK